MKYSRYAEEEECLSRVQENQELTLGAFYDHFDDWVVGFADDKDDMVFVPNNTRLTGNDGMEYLVKVEERKTPGLFVRGHLAYLYSAGKISGMNSQAVVDLQSSLPLRHNQEERRKIKFRVVEVGSELSSLVQPKKMGLFSKLLARIAC